MEDFVGYETVRQKLILAGISELQTHSSEDLSLRKIAARCNVSCAAPYKHFKNKAAFLAAIMAYIEEQWQKLRSQVMEAFAHEETAQITEVCIAYIRFCMANPNFRRVLDMQRRPEEEAACPFSGPEGGNLICAYCRKHGRNAAQAEEKALLLTALVHGSVALLEQGRLDNSDETIRRIRALLQKELAF